MPRKRVEPSANENWIKEENLTQWKKKAQQLVADRNRYEKEQIKAGKKQILVDHPIFPRCKIIKFV